MMNDEISALNNALITEAYQPEPLVLEAPKKLEDGFSMEERIQSRSASVVEEIRRFEAGIKNVTPLATSARNAEATSGSLPRTTPYSSNSSVGGYRVGESVRSYSADSRGEYERVRDRFGELRRKGYQMAEEELKNARQTPKKQANPHLAYIRAQEDSAWDRIKRALSGDHAKQILAIAGIIGLQTVISILREEYRDVFTEKGGKKK